MRSFQLILTILATTLLAAAPSAAGQLIVGTGASFDLGTGSLGLGCGDLLVSGTMSAGSAGLAQARDLTIAPGGTLNGNSATLEVAGNWDNAGSFSAGTSTVQLVDGCGLSSAVISGDTTFANLDLTTTSAFLYEFTAGSTQTVSGMLTLAGASGNLLMIGSTTGGSVAFVNVLGSSSADFVDVEDNDASGGKPISDSAPAKPKPWSKPKIKATTQGARLANPGRPRCL